MKKRHLVIGKWLSVLLLTAAVLTGCSRAETNEASAKEPVKVTFWHYYNDAQKEGLDAMVTEYNETVGREKNIRVEAVAIGSIEDITVKLESALDSAENAADRPDIFLAYRDTLQEIRKEAPDALLDFHTCFSEEELGNYYPDFLAEGEFENGLYIIPAAKSTELLFMNQTMLERFFEENPTYSPKDMETWESIGSMAEAFYNWTDAMTPEKENDGKALLGLDNFSNYFIAQNHALGSEIYRTDEDGRVRFMLDEDCIRKLFSAYYIPYTKGYYGGSEKYRSDDMRKDTLYGYIGSVASVAYFPKTIFCQDGSEQEIEMGIYPYPYFAAGEKTAVSQGAGIAALDGGADKNKAAAEFIKWISGEKSVEYAAMLSYMPTNKEVVEKESFEAVSDENVRRAVGMTQVKDYKMVRGFDFENSYAVRMELEDYFSECLQRGREEYAGYLAEGMTSGEAAEAMKYEEKAAAFYRQIVKMFYRKQGS